ncbi:hypothetical protein [Microbacterium sp. BF1]|uniref:hypothetical protein n=1 Tax=Microbacterium sp. BF1 TaxID=2821146 RepID=UPI002119CD56|nr:hypothetical protein [Microbacterium sp. BF1]
MSAPWQVSRESLPPTSRLLIERAHEELLAGNLEDRRLQEVRPLVRESWERSWRGRVGPEGAPPLDLVSDELDAYRLAHPLASVMDMIRALLLPGEAEDTGVIIAVGDQAGRAEHGDLRTEEVVDGHRHVLAIRLRHGEQVHALRGVAGRERSFERRPSRLRERAGGGAVLPGVRIHRHILQVEGVGALVDEAHRDSDRRS